MRVPVGQADDFASQTGGVEHDRLADVRRDDGRGVGHVSDDGDAMGWWGEEFEWVCVNRWTVRRAASRVCATCGSRHPTHHSSNGKSYASFIRPKSLSEDTTVKAFSRAIAAIQMSFSPKPSCTTVVRRRALLSDGP